MSVSYHVRTQKTMTWSSLLWKP